MKNEKNLQEKKMKRYTIVRGGLENQRFSQKQGNVLQGGIKKI